MTTVDPKNAVATVHQTVTVNRTNGQKKRYKIVYDREGCIGAAACVAAYPERWQLMDDGKADITGEGAKRNDDNTEQTLEISEEEFQKMMDSAQACPVTVIHIVDLETGQRVI
jgi:ferredoxin